MRLLIKHKKNRTYFKNREGVKNDVYEKKENFKDFLRSFKFYKYEKFLKKKYLRKKGINNYLSTKSIPGYLTLFFKI